MSVNPTTLLARAGVIAALAALAVPGGALAHHKDWHDQGPKKDKHAADAKPGKDGKDGKEGKDGAAGKDAPAACDADKKNRHPHGGPPGLTKKADEMPECRDVDEQKAAAQAAPAPAPAPAPVTVVAQSRALPPCESRRHFRITLDRSRGRRLKVRKARVLLNGRAISVTKGNKRRRWTALIDLRRRAKGTYTVRYSVVTRSGRLVTGTRRFRTCG